MYEFGKNCTNCRESHKKEKECGEDCKSIKVLLICDKCDRNFGGMRGSSSNGVDIEKSYICWDCINENN